MNEVFKQDAKDAMPAPQINAEPVTESARIDWALG